MKKGIKIVLVLIVLATVFSFFTKDDGDHVTEKEPKTNLVATDDTTPIDSNDKETILSNPYEGNKAEIYNIVMQRIESGDYLNTTISEIKLNDNLGTDIEGDYILLVYGSFDIKNSKETGNKVLRMYADDLMATLAGEGIVEVVEGAVFWKDDYNNRTVKYAYEYKDGEFFITDVMGE